MAEPIQVIREIAVKANLYHALFTSEIGKQVLALLEEEFCGCSFVPGDPHQTSFNEGRRYVVTGIKDVVALAEQPMVVVDVEEAA